MPKVAVYTVAGQQIGDIELNESVFGVEVNEGLVHQAVVMQLAARRLAIKCALTDKVNNGDFIVLESLDFAAPKTKEVVKMMSDFNVAEKALIVTADVVENVEKSSRNIPGVKAISSCGLNVYDILNHNKLFITKDAITRIEEVLA